jgi:hypothetical protein
MCGTRSRLQLSQPHGEFATKEFGSFASRQGHSTLLAQEDIVNVGCNGADIRGWQRVNEDYR